MYTYPIDFDLFNQEEIIIIIEFLSMIEDINEGKKVDQTKFQKQYKLYKNTINSMSLEKQIDKDFKSVSGYSIYKTIQKFQ